MDGPRPCPWVSCRYHLFEELAPRLLGVPKDELRRVSDERFVAVLQGMEFTCALDWAARGPNTLEQIGQMFGLTRERIRQIQQKGLRKLTAKWGSQKKDIVELLQEVATSSGVLEWK